jgi:hypothetical protein
MESLLLSSLPSTPFLVTHLGCENFVIYTLSDAETAKCSQQSGDATLDIIQGTLLTSMRHTACLWVFYKLNRFIFLISRDKRDGSKRRL